MGNKELRAVAIGPDRIEIVVGYGTNDELSAWYRSEVNINETEWVDYDVREFPMDKKLGWEEAGEMTLRELVDGCTDFPLIAGWEE